MSFPLSMQENWSQVSQLQTLSGSPLGSCLWNMIRINMKGLSGKCPRVQTAINPLNTAAPHVLPPITNWCFSFYFHHYNHFGEWDICANVWRTTLRANKSFWEPIMAEYFISKWRIRKLINYILMKAHQT